MILVTIYILKTTNFHQCLHRDSKSNRYLSVYYSCTDPYLTSVKIALIYRIHQII